MPKRIRTHEKSETRREHIKELKKSLEQISGGPVPMGFSEDCPLELQEKFLESVLRFERTQPVVLFDKLQKDGARLPSPEELEDGAVHATLWEVIHRMAILGAYLENTDHLSDRTLYHKLWHEILREPVVILPDDPDYDCFCDLVGGEGRNALQIWLKHYADDDERQRWQEAWPDNPLPEQARPPYDRDRFLPQPFRRARAGTRGVEIRAARM
jgi:hypothetical protein